MADVTGPISSLPGSFHRVPVGAKCDDHPDRPAWKRVQGETDSFGSEMIDMCADCFAKYQTEIKEEQKREEANPSRACQWCGIPKLLRSHRDWEEGERGPVYSLCSDCIAKNKAANTYDDPY